MPVPTSGASGCSSGTAWRCMFEPMSARLASSFSRNGISAAATDTSWFGDTSMKCELLRRHHPELAALARPRPARSVNRPLRVDLRVGLGDDVLLFLRGVEELRSRRSPCRRFDLAVRRLDEAELVDAGVGRQRRDQADVRAFRRLDRADAAVVRGVHVAHLEARALAASDRRARARTAAACASARPAGWSGP